MMRTRLLPSLILAALCCTTVVLNAQARFNEEQAERDQRHATVEWAAMSPHLPDAITGTAASLQTAGDVLRARRMPEDALDYYRYAVQRGGDQETLLKRIGITQLELRQVAAARLSFQRAVSLKKKDGEAWNDLGATEYVLANFRAAVSDYQKAIKLNKKTAVYHSNLGTAYFETKDFESARKQFEAAVALDPTIFHHAGYGGVEAHILSPADRGKFCFELARLAARHQQDALVVEWLGKASEIGFDINYEMGLDQSFLAYEKDPRILLIEKNAKTMRSGQVASAIPAPPMAPEQARD